MYKKYAVFRCGTDAHVRTKLWRVMKLSFFICLIAFMQLRASSVAQKINLEKKGASLQETLNDIRRQVGYSILCDAEIFTHAKPVNVVLKGASLEETLKKVFFDQPLTYLIDQTTILIKYQKHTEVNRLINVAGRVRGENNLPLAGVSVRIENTQNGVSTNEEGYYKITAPDEKAVLIFSYIGFVTQRIEVGSREVIDVKLLPANDALDELVIVGYGKQKKADLTGSVATVKGEELAKSTAASTVNTLAGRLPGLVVKQTSGQPGFDQSRFNIRNFGTALIIVDGVEQSFNNINPSEIESISILKDASAAIYGARAGNGVVLVTTKRGAVNNKPVITLSSTFTEQKFTSFGQPVNAGQYATLYREAQLNAGIPESQIKFSENDIEKYFEGNDPKFPSTNWETVIMKDLAPQQQHNLSVSGGSDKVKYYTFLGFLNQGGMFKGNNTGYDRYNLRSNIDVAISSRFNMSIDVNGIKEDVKQSSRPASEEWFWMDFLDSRPTSAASFPDPTKVPSISPGPYNAIINTHEDIGGYNKSYTTSLNAAASLNYKVLEIEGLDLKLKLNYNNVATDQKIWRKQVQIWNYNYDTDVYTLAGTSEPTTLTQAFSSNQTITGQLSANYNRIFAEDHSVNALLLYEVIDYAGKSFSGFRQHYISNAIDQLFAGGTSDQLSNGSASQSGRNSYVGRLNYGFRGKYLLEGTLRYDGSPNFPPSKRWGLFPSVSAGWRVSEESFIKDNLPFINNLKIRGGLSQTGYDGVAAYQYLTGYKFSNIYVIDGKEVPTIVSTGLPNPNITWEKMTLTNIGFDLSLFNDRLYTEVDIFSRLRGRMLGTRVAALPSTFGATLPSENINSQRTRGFEFLLGTRGNAGDFKYDISANISYSRSKWVHFDEVTYNDPDEVKVYKKSGEWVDRGFGYKSDGLFTAQEEIDNLNYDMDGQGNKTLRPGDIKILDLNHDGKIDFRDYTIVNNGGTPHIMYGLNANFQYKDFDFSFLIQGAADYTINLQAGNINIDSERTPTMLIWNERWTPENNNKDAIIPRQKLGQTTNNWNSDYWNRNASYARLKNLTLGYSFNPKLLSDVGIKKLRVFFSGLNLLSINPLKKYSLDPETSDSTRGWSYPIQKTYSLGLNVSF